MVALNRYTTVDNDRVRRSTASRVNADIDKKTDENIRHYSTLDKLEVSRRIRELDGEWDVERVLEVNASSLALSGLVLSFVANRKWLYLTGGVLAFLLQHGVQGWCPPLPVLRRLGARTRGEIDREKYALKALIDQK